LLRQAQNRLKLLIAQENSVAALARILAAVAR